ncbi:MAG: T9SS C-terminal target domain-containing protein, partial [Chlorobiota bacterium]
TDGGSTWTNVSSGLPNVPVNCIALDPRNGNVYVGTDIGIYLRTPAASQWTMWDDGLPNVIVRDLELDTATNRIYAATYGRGIWQGTLLNQTLTAGIWASRTTLCAGDTVRLADASSGQVATRQWTISGGSPATATDSALTVTFPNPGQFTVRLVVSSGTLVDSAQVTVTVNPRPSVTVSLSAQHVCEGDSIVAVASGNAIARYQWNTGDTTQRIVLRAVGTYSLQVLVTSAAGCSTASAVVQCSILARPPVPSVSITGRNPFCEGDSVVLSAPSGFSAYWWNTGATTQQITVRNGGSYLVTVTDANGCSRQSDTIRVVRWPKPPLTMQVFGRLSFCEGDSVVLQATSSPGAAFFWLDGSGAQGNRRVIRSGGTYAVLVIDTNGCRIQSQPFVVTVFPKPIPRLTVLGPTTLCGNETTTLDAGEEFAQYRWNTGQTTRTITVSQPGLYWCICTTVQGCSNTSDTVSITRGVAVRPRVTSSTGRFEACFGDTIELDAGPGYIVYAWNTGDTTRRIAVTGSGEYVVSVVTAAGCGGSSDTVRVRFYDPPAEPEIIREGNRLRCSIDGVQYQWFRNGIPIGGATEQTLEITESGQYGVRITDANGCSAERQDYSAIVSVADKRAQSWVTLEPNPAEEDVLVRIESTLPSSVELYDLYGRLVLQHWTFDASGFRTQVRLNLQGIARGTYVVLVRSGQFIARLRLVRW